MKLYKLLILACGLMLGANVSLAQDADNLTMSVIDDATATVTDAIMNDIVLPDSASGEDGLATATTAKLRALDGLATAGSVVEMGRDMAADAAAAAADNRESAGRDIPGTPDVPPPPGPP